MGNPFENPRPRVTPKGRAAVLQAKLILLVMINIAQLWILAATIEAALARHFSELPPLIIASGVCWFIGITVLFWWKPATSKRDTIGK